MKNNPPPKKKRKLYKKPKEKHYDFSHIKGDIDDFIFFFCDNKNHSEK